MATIENKLGKLVERNGRGLLTDAEFANDVLLVFAAVDESQRVTELFASLPDRLQTSVRNRLKEIQGSGFNWRPFLIGEELSEDLLWADAHSYCVTPLRS